LVRLFLVQLVAIVLIQVFITPKLFMPLLAPIWQQPFLGQLQITRAGGVAHLLANRLNAQPDYKHSELIQALQMQFPYVVDVQSLEGLSLTDSQVATLHQQQLIVDPSSDNLYKLLDNKTHVILIGHGEDRSEYSYTYTQLESLGIIALFEYALKPYPQSQWEAIFAKKAKHFDYPISLVALEKLEVTEEEWHKVKQGRLVTRQVDEVMEYGSGLDYFFKRIPDTHWVISAGPIAQPITDVVVTASRISFGLIGMVIVVPLIIWLTPTWRSMKHLAQATQAFGVGDFSARAKIIRASHLNLQAKVFNEMAEKTQSLFNSNKMLTHAVSDELHGPLVNIEGSLAQLQHQQSEAEIEVLADSIETSVDELKYLTSQILLYGRLDREKSNACFEPVDLNQWLHDEKRRWQLDIHSEKRAIVSVRENSQPIIISINTYYLGLAIDNLIYEMTRSAESRISIRARRDDRQAFLIMTLTSDYATAESSRAISNHSSSAQLSFAIAKKIAGWHSAAISVDETECVIRFPL
jgi:signal transduction histidine kinase